MKIVNFLFIILVVFSACNPSKKSEQTIKFRAPVVFSPDILILVREVGFVEWDKDTISIGKLKKGEKRQFSFEFTNTSGAKIQVSSVNADEFTKVEFSDKVIKNGKKGRLTVTFDSTNQEDSQPVSIQVLFKKKDESSNQLWEEFLTYSFELIDE